MKDKYNKEFEEIYQKIFIKGENPLEIIGDYKIILENEKITRIRLLHYVGEYVRER